MILDMGEAQMQASAGTLAALWDAYLSEPGNLSPMVPGCPALV